MGTQGRPLFSQRFELVGHQLDQLVIFVRIGHQLRSAVHQQIGIGIALHGKGLHGQQQEIFRLAGAQGGRAPFHADVERGIGSAHNGELCAGEGVLIVAGAGIQCDGIPDGKSGFLQKPGFCQTLLRGLGQAAFQQFGTVDLLGIGEHLGIGILFAGFHHGVNGIGALTELDSRLFGQ